jgi:hypothetical protein
MTWLHSRFAEQRPSFETAPSPADLMSQQAVKPIKFSANSAAPCPRRESQGRSGKRQSTISISENHASRRPAWQEIVGFLDRAPDLYQNAVEYGLTFARLTQG